MIFNAMWNSEIERFAVKKCSRLAMRLYAYADWCSLLAFISLFILWIVLKIKVWWWSVLLWALGRAVYLGYWHILTRHEFDYDDENACAAWRDNAGIRQTYTQQDYLNETNN